MKFVEKIGDEEVTFPVLSLPEYEQVESAVRQSRQAELKKYLDEAGLKGKDRFDALVAARPDHVDPSAVLSYTETLDGTRKVLGLSLAKAGRTAEQIGAVLGRLEFHDGRNLATSVLRFTRRLRSGMKSADEAEDPLP